jgi:hypothetical protein
MLKPNVRSIFVVCLIALALEANGQETLDAFPGLQPLHLKDVGVTLYYDPKLSQVLNGVYPDADTYDKAGVFVSRPLRTRLLGANQGYFTIDCDSGGSWDPSCTFLQEDNGKLKPVAHIDGLRFVLPGNGNIYVDGHNDTMFNVRKKYEWRSGSFLEMKQPFRYVGIDSTIRENIKIYSSRDYKDVVATLPKDARVSVILNEGEDYLLKTPFGLLGWLRIPDGTAQEDSPIIGIYFAGD